jgi:hypothetical protein
MVSWRVMFTDWHPIYIRNEEMPVQIQRRLGAVGDVVYADSGNELWRISGADTRGCEGARPACFGRYAC